MATEVYVLLLSTVFALLGFLGKLALEGLREWRERRDARRASLVEIQAILLASKSIFLVQLGLVKELSTHIRSRMPTYTQTMEYDDLLACAFGLDDFMTADERDTHAIIRAYTIEAIAPLNKSALDWLKADAFYKTADDELGRALRKLEAHLILWFAKYRFWIEPRPERTLVFLADGKDHGIGFPNGIEDLISHRLISRSFLIHRSARR